jgi:hypothetical protein
VCAPAVTGLCIDVEANLGKPTVPIILSSFMNQVKENAMTKGMPNLRFEFIKGPVWAKTPEQLRRDVVEGKSPVSGKPVMQEIIEKLTKPLTDEEKKTGEIIRDKGPATFTDTPDNLQKMFLEKRMTDFLPIVLPTEAKVNEMLKATSHRPEEVLGRMAPTMGVFETWSYTVKDAAVNAVMAGARPEYFPIILAVGSTGKEGISVSDNGFVEALVINGAIRDEIGLNYEIGAMGPYALANTTIGRAWNLLSINGGNCGKVGTTYMGTVGNPMNLINIVIAENERDSPWKPFSVRKGYKQNENIVSLFEGWGVLSAKNWKFNVWGKEMNYPQIIKDIFYVQSPDLFGATAVLSPPIANFVKDAGFDTVEKFEEWLMNPPEGQKPNLTSARQMNIIVTGGSNNNYYSIGGLSYRQSVKIDEWR